MSVKVDVKVRDRGLNKLLEVARSLPGKASVKVGVFAGAGTGGDTREGGLTNVEIAAIHEFGAAEANIPERSFIRATFDRNGPKYRAMIVKLLPRVLAGKLDLDAMLDIVGQQIVADINNYVRGEGVPPPLAQATIDRKGSSRALIDTGRLLASITYVSVLGGQA